MGNIKILTIGDSSCDNILEVDEREAGLLCDLKSHKCEISFKYGDKIPVKAVHAGFGGSALNCSIGFKRLGFENRISTIVGNDELGKNIIKFLNRCHIGLNLVQVQGLTNQSTIINFKGERTIFSYHHQRNYAKSKFYDADWIYLASSGKGSNIYLDELIKLKENGARIAFNPGSWQLKNFTSFSKITKVCDVLILNRFEADLVFGSEDNLKEQLKKMNDAGAKIAVITDAKNGAYFSSRGGVVHLNTASAQLVDATGAGDSFSCGFVGALALGHSLEESAKWGMVNSASVIEQFGANTGLLRVEVISKRVRANKSFKITLL